MQEDELEINKVYNLTAKRYYNTRNSMGTIHSTFIVNPAIRNLLKDIKGKRLLDIGCGFGEDLKYFHKQGAEVIGIELNEELIKIAKQDPALKNIEILQGSVYSLDFKHAFDICLANLVLDQVKDLKKALSEVYKAMKRGGSFIFSVAHPLNCATNNYKEQLSDYFLARKGFFSPNSMTHKIPFYYRNFNDYSDALFNAGFLIRRIIEPKPQEEAKFVFEDEYTKFSKLPDILIIEAIKI